MTFAERNYNHKDYGIFVSIKADNGKYVNLSAHLSGLASGIRKGVRVTDATIIGYGGDSGGPNILTGQPHLHQAYYRYPATTLTGHRTVAWGCAGHLPPLHRHRVRHQPQHLQVRLDVQLDDLGEGRPAQQLKSRVCGRAPIGRLTQLSS